MSPVQVPGDRGWSCSSSPGPQAKGCVRGGESSLLTGSPNSPWPSRSKAEEQDLQVEGDREGQASIEEGRRGAADEGAAHLPGGSAPPHPPHPPRSPPLGLADMAMPTSPTPPPNPGEPLPTADEGQANQHTTRGLGGSFPRGKGGAPTRERVAASFQVRPHSSSLTALTHPCNAGLLSNPQPGGVFPAHTLPWPPWPSHLNNQVLPRAGP